MGFFVRSRGLQWAVWIGLGAAGVLAAPAACLFPDYTFNQQGPGGSSSTTGTGGGKTEDCGNGIDDNGDGHVDCEDPQCTAYACIPEVPSTWTGYFALYDGPPAQDPGCPAQFPSTSTPPFVGNRDISVPPATCACSCGPAQGQTCASLDTMVVRVHDAACNTASHCGGDLPVKAGWTGTCYGPDAFPGGTTTCGASSDCTTTANGTACNVSVTATAVAATGGTCAPGHVTVKKTDVSWGGLGRGCAADTAGGKGCNIGQVCMPKPSGAFQPGICIFKDGDNPCPAGAFTSKHVYYTDVQDDRSCTDDCSCGAPSGGTCPTMVTVYSDPQLNTCINKLVTFAAGGCANLTGNPAVAGRTATAPAPPTGGTCTPSGGTPTGDAKGTSPRTFCCVP